jgi:DNA-binding MarR family transcriptional regulator
MPMRDLVRRRRTNLGRLLIRGYRAINLSLLDELRGAGDPQLRFGHFKVLTNLDLTGGTRQVTIAERAGVTKQSVGPIVRELEAMGYVRTQPDPHDRRATLVSLTSAGRRVIDNAQPLIDRIEDSIRSRMGEAPFEMLIELLGRLLEGFDEGDAYPQH